MSTAYQTQNYTQGQPAGTGHGVFQMSTHLHATSGAIATWVAGDTVLIGYLPRGAVVMTVGLKAAGQLDSNGAPTLALDLGIVGTPQLFKSAVTTVGHAAGASADLTINAAGQYYLNNTGGRVAVVATVHTAAATPVSGTLEVDIEYFVQDAVGSPA